MMSMTDNISRAAAEALVRQYRQAKLIGQLHGKNAGDRECHKMAKEMLDRLLDAIRSIPPSPVEGAGLREALDGLVNAKALKGVRELVAGWNGENRPDGPYEPHHAKLGATLPKTNCGAIYDLDTAMQKARAALSPQSPTGETE